MKVGEPERLIGRGTALQDTLAALGAGVSVVVLGQAGIGKTRLAAEVVDRLSDSHRCERILASSTMQPFELGALATLGHPPRGRLRDADLIVAWYVNRWRSLAAGGQIIVWIDDAHLLDEISAQVVVAGVKSRDIVLLATHRTPHELPKALARLDEPAEITLDPLTRPQCRELLRLHSLGDGRSSPELDEIIEASDGVPRFLLDLARSEAIGIEGQTLRSLTDRCLLALSAPALTLAEWLAVTDNLSNELIDKLDSGSALEELIAASLVAVDPIAETVALAHPLYRSRLVIAIDERHTFAALLDHLDATDTRSFVSETTIARWTIRAGRTLEVDVAVRSAAESMGRLDHREAARFVAALPDGPAVDLIRARIDIATGRDHAGVQRLQRCLQSDDNAVHLSALSELVRTYVFSNRASSAREALRSSAAKDRGAQHLRTILSLRAMAHAFDGADPDLLNEVREYLETTAIDDYASMSLAASCAMSLSGVGDFAAAASLIERGHRYLADGGADLDPMMRDRVASVDVLHHLWAGAPDRAVEVAQRGHQTALQERCHENELLRAHQVAILATAAGDYATAARLAEETVDARAHANLFDTSDRSTLLSAATLLGDHQLADRARDMEIRDTSIPYKLVGRLTAESLHDQLRGHKRSDRELRVAMEQLSELGHLGWVVTFAITLLVVEPDAWLTDLVESTADRTIEAGLIQPIAELAGGLANAKPAALEKSATHIEQLGLAHLAATGWAAASRLLADVDPARSFRAERAAERNLARCSRMATCWQPALPKILTVRQSAIAQLIAEGASPAQIAMQGNISQRTVTNHLHAAYRTLGISRRSELVELLTRPPRIPPLVTS